MQILRFYKTTPIHAFLAVVLGYIHGGSPECPHFQDILVRRQGAKLGHRAGCS